MDEKDAKRKGQVEQEVDVLEDATATLIKKLSELNDRLQSICCEREPLDVKAEQDESRVALALALHTFSLRVDESIDRIDSIMERLEL